jgi:hypothetical protein
VGVGSSQRRATIQEAARIMGVSEGAVRKRVKRGTIAHDKGEGGRVYVYLDAGVDEGVDDVSYPERDALISELRSHNATLQKQLEQANERDRENRRIIAALTQRIPAIEAPQEATETPSEATPQPGRVEPQPAVQSTQAQESPEMAMPEAGGGPLPRDQQTASERPWWRRVFGG